MKEGLKGKSMKVNLFSLFRQKKRREKGEKYKNIHISRCRQTSFTPGLKYNFHYQLFAIISAAHYFSCCYPIKFQLLQTNKRFKEKFYLFTSKFIHHFNPQQTFFKNLIKKGVIL